MNDRLGPGISFGALGGKAQDHGDDRVEPGWQAQLFSDAGAAQPGNRGTHPTGAQPMQVQLQVNGKAASAEVEPRTLLIHY